MIIVLMSLVIAGIVYACSDTISLWTVDSKELSLLYRIGAFIILFIAVSSALQSALIGFESFKSVSVFEIVYGITSILITSF